MAIITINSLTLLALFMTTKITRPVELYVKCAEMAWIIGPSQFLREVYQREMHC